MKTVVFTDIKKVDVQECPIPEIKPDKVLVKIDACALCTWEQRVYTGVKKVHFPFIGGHEMVGKIVGMGENVDKLQWNMGDSVAVGVMSACKNCYACKSGNEQSCENFNHSLHIDGLPYKGMGGLSEYLLVDPSNMFQYYNVTPEEATVTEPLSCVLHSVEVGKVEFGNMVVVIGAGIMGLLHTLLSIRKGASVIISDMNEERLELAKKLGARYTVNPSKEDLGTRVMELTHGVGAQVVFDTTPIAAVVAETFKCVSNTGRIVLYSSFYPDSPVSFSPDWLHKQSIQILGTANSNSGDFVKATRLISEGIIDVKPFISETYELKDVRDAFESAAKADKFRVVVKF